MSERAKRNPIPVRRELRELGDHVLTWRKLRGLTQAQVAGRANVDRSTLARVEQGDGSVSLEIFLRVLHALGVLEGLDSAIDPHLSDVGRMRADEELPRRVRPRNLAGGIYE